MSPDPELLLIAPHRFPDLELETEMARRHGLRMHLAQDQTDLNSHVPQAKIIMMTPFVSLTADVIATARSCCGIVRYGAGVDNIDVEAATRYGIPVANVPAASTAEVAVSAVTMGLALIRRIPEADRSLRDGSWDSSLMGGVRRVSELTVGVVGLGNIGALVAGYWHGFGAKVVVSDPVRTESTWHSINIEALVKIADVITLHVPLTPQTRNLLSRERIASMKPGALVVNTARGGLIDEDALAAALQDNKIGGAAIDVFDAEPIAATNALLGAPRTLLTPHVSWRSDSAVADYQRIAVEAANAALSGSRMPSTINES